MEPNDSIGRDDDRNGAVRSMRPSSAAALLPPPPHRRVDQGDSGGRVSRLRTRDANDDGLTLQSVICADVKGSRPLRLPRRT